jgi:hypothetical protein
MFENYISKIFLLTFLFNVTLAQAHAASVDGLTLELNFDGKELTVLLVNSDVEHPTIEYPFQLLYGADKSGLDISFVLKVGASDAEKKILCPIINLPPEQFPKEVALFSGNVVGQRFSKKRLMALYCLQKKEYLMTVRFYYAASSEGTPKYVEATSSIDFSR